MRDQGSIEQFVIPNLAFVKEMEISYNFSLKFKQYICNWTYFGSEWYKLGYRIDHFNNVKILTSRSCRIDHLLCPNSKISQEIRKTFQNIKVTVGAEIFIRKQEGRKMGCKFLKNHENFIRVIHFMDLPGFILQRRYYFEARKKIAPNPQFIAEINRPDEEGG